MASKLATAATGIIALLGIDSYRTTKLTDYENITAITHSINFNALVGVVSRTFSALISKSVELLLMKSISLLVLWVLQGTMTTFSPILMSVAVNLKIQNLAFEISNPGSL